ncbi:hypothetical protein OS493_000675 [Desmophyllum pertusum]|uniref:Uncharacterized protein n=1 Tax=Desmophyllum pertusum TaxID=174260 RepID=A0A9X0A7P9_9CNID|nr:hypothetical protein OS493_000675 [Desmophyllum pertusum]
METSFINEEEAVNLPQQNRAEKNIDSRISKETATEEGSLKQQNREVSRTRKRKQLRLLLIPHKWSMKIVPLRPTQPLKRGKTDSRGQSELLLRYIEEEEAAEGIVDASPVVDEDSSTQADSAIEDNSTQADSAIEDSSTQADSAIEDSSTEANSAIEDCSTQANSAIEDSSTQANSAIEDSSTQANSAIEDSSTQADSAIEDSSTQANSAIEDSSTQADSAIEDSSTQADSAIEDCSTQADSAMKTVPLRPNSAIEDSSTQADSAIEDSSTQADSAIEDSSTEANSAIEDSSTQADSAIEDSSTQADSAIEDCSTQADSTIEDCSTQADSAIEESSSQAHSAIEEGRTDSRGQSKVLLRYTEDHPQGTYYTNSAAKTLEAKKFPCSQQNGERTHDVVGNDIVFIDTARLPPRKMFKDKREYKSYSNSLALIDSKCRIKSGMGKYLYKILKDKFFDRIAKCIIHKPELKLKALFSVVRPFLKREMKQAIFMTQTPQKLEILGIADTVIKCL